MRALVSQLEISNGIDGHPSKASKVHHELNYCLVNPTPFYDNHAPCLYLLPPSILLHLDEDYLVIEFYAI